MATAVLIVVWFTHILTGIVFGQIVVAFACAGDADAVRARTISPPFVLVAFCTITAAAINCICFADLRAILGFKAVIGFTFTNLALALGTAHGLCMGWFIGVAVMVAFAAMLNTARHIDAGTVANLGICRALTAALAATTYLIVGALCTGCAAALCCVHYTIAHLIIYMITVDALHDFALAIRACTRLPAGDAIGTGKPFLAAILDGIINASILIRVHVILAGSHMACAFNAVSICPT